MNLVWKDTHGKYHLATLEYAARRRRLLVNLALRDLLLPKHNVFESRGPTIQVGQLPSLVAADPCSITQPYQTSSPPSLFSPLPNLFSAFLMTWCQHYHKRGQVMKG
jgi:hypothetical protein